MHRRNQKRTHPTLADTNPHPKKISKNLEDWFNPKILALYGVKNQSQVAALLKTPGDKALRSLIARTLAERDALQKIAIKTAQEKKHERALNMLLLGLIYEEKLEAKHHRDAIQEQAAIDHRVHPKKTPVEQEDTTERLKIYTESADALKAVLTEKTEDLNTLHADWDHLESIIDTHHARNTAHDELLKNLTRLFDGALSADEETHIDWLKDLTLQKQRKEYQLVRQNDTYYLIPKGVTLESLSGSEQAAAEKAFRDLKPRLEKSMAASREDEALRIEARKTDLIHKLAPLHEDIRVLTQQLVGVTKAMALLKAAIAPQHNHHNTLAASYGLLNRALAHTSQSAQRTPIFKAVHEDLNALDLTAINRAGGPKFLPELHRFIQGANNITSAGQTQKQTLNSLIKNAEGFAAFISEAPTARRFQMAEQMHTPKPVPIPEPESTAPRPSPFNK
jgi:hypothetical protein